VVVAHYAFGRDGSTGATRPDGASRIAVLVFFLIQSASGGDGSATKGWSEIDDTTGRRDDVRADASTAACYDDARDAWALIVRSGRRNIGSQ
jgi:hypothetical protein